MSRATAFPTRSHVRPAMTRINLCNRAVRSQYFRARCYGYWTDIGEHCPELEY